MKKLYSLVLIASMAILLAACGDKKESNKDSNKDSNATAVSNENVSEADVEMTTEENTASFTMKNDGTFTFNGVGTVVTGKVEGSSIKVGDAVVITGGEKEIHTTITYIEVNRESVDSANIGDNVAIGLDNVSRVDVPDGVIISADTSSETANNTANATSIDTYNDITSMEAFEETIDISKFDVNKFNGNIIKNGETISVKDALGDESSIYFVSGVNGGLGISDTYKLSDAFELNAISWNEDTFISDNIANVMNLLGQPSSYKYVGSGKGIMNMYYEYDGYVIEVDISNYSAQDDATSADLLKLIIYSK